MSDYFCDSFTTDQLLLCEKEELVKYIEELREVRELNQEDIKKLKEEISDMYDDCVNKSDIYEWVESDGSVILDKDEYLKLTVTHKPVTRSDTRIKQLEEQVDKLQIQSHLCDISVILPMKNHVTKLTDECAKLKERVEELDSQIELTNECVIDGLKQGHKDLQEEIDRLQEENEKLKEDFNRYRKYLYDKDYECEEQRERADYNEKEIMKLKEENDELKKKDIRDEIKKSKELQKKVKNIGRDANEISVVMMKICKHYTDIYSE